MRRPLHPVPDRPGLLASAADPDPDPEPNPFASGWDKPVDPDKDCKFKREKGGLTIEVPGKPTTSASSWGG